MHGRKGVTNSFHMLGTVDFTYYLRKWRNLYHFSQQGWESLNAMIKSFIFRRNQQQGGHRSRKDEANQRIKPIARWIQRQLLFVSGSYKLDFDNAGRSIKN
jgi:hypothetical protein